MNSYLRKILPVLAASILVLGTSLNAAEKLVIKVAPASAYITVTTPTGSIAKKGDNVITNARVDFKRYAYYNIQVIPTGEAIETHLETNIKLDSAAYARLQSVAKKTRELVVKMDEKSFVNIDEVQEQLTPEGNWVLVKVKRRSFKDIAESGGSVPALIYDLGERQGITGMSLSPDGKRIVFAQTVYDMHLNEIEESTALNGGGLILPSQGSNLRSIQIGGGGVQHITTENFNDKFPTYSRDGEYLIFSSNRRRSDLSDILRVKATGRSGISDIYVNHRNALIMKPTIANDGTMAIELCSVDSYGGKISVGDHFVWTVGGGNEYPTQITKGYQPTISPDGSKIVFIGADGNLWVTSADGSNKTQLTTNAGEIERRYYELLSPTEKNGFDALKDSGIRPIYPFSLPSWSPDGQYVLYSSMEGNDPTGRPNEDIWIMDYEGGSKQQLTTNGSIDKYALMSNEMDSIYFISNRGQQWALWRIAVEL